MAAAAASIVHASIKHAPFDVRIFQRQCCSLAAAGYRVHWYVPGPPTAERDGVYLHDLPVWVSIARRPWAATSVLHRTARTLIAAAADVYVLHDPELLPVGFALKRAGKRVIFDAHEHYRRKLMARGSLPLPVRRAFARAYLALEARAAACFDGFIGAAEHIAAEYPAERTIVLHNYPRADLARAPAATLDPTVPPRLIYTGGWTAFRGVTQIVQALAYVTTPGVRLSVLGPRQTYNTVYADAAATPQFAQIDDIGYVPYEVMVEHLRRAHVGLVLNQPVHDYENAQPNKLFEYMAVGLPVIAADFPTWRQIVRGSGAGVTVESTDPKAIAAAIDAMLARPIEERRAMGAAGRRAVLARYSWEAEFPRYLDLLDRLLARAPR